MMQLSILPCYMAIHPTYSLVVLGSFHGHRRPHHRYSKTNSREQREQFEKALLALMKPFRFKDGAAYFNPMDVGLLTPAYALRQRLRPDAMEKIRETAKQAAAVISGSFASAEWAKRIPDGQDVAAFISATSELRLDVTGKIARLIQTHFQDLATLLIDTGAGRGNSSAVLIINLVSTSEAEMPLHSNEQYRDYLANLSMFAGFGCNRLARKGTQETPWQEPVAAADHRFSREKSFQFTGTSRILSFLVH